MSDVAIERVHVVFKTHLDLGFTDMASAVEERYRTQYIPRAIDLAEELADAGGDEQFIWTTGSWLIDMCLRSGEAQDVARLERAIAARHVAWHALPLTTHSELMDPSLFRFGISIAHRLDQRFQRRTIAAKMTDVPGHTQGVVGLLAEAGIQYLHLGVNPASTRPDVPLAFRWNAPDGPSIVVNYADSYGSSSIIPGTRDALEFAHTGDNSGPPTAADVRGIFASLREKYPGATVMASTLDRYAQAILGHAERLPVVAEEIGDTWIHGVGTDPIKVARFRELLRLRAEWESAGTLNTGDREYQEMSERLLLIAEHTWGLDVKTWLPDFVSYARPAFEAARAHDVIDGQRVPAKFQYISTFTLSEAHTNTTAEALADGTALSFSRMEASWAEQREYLVNSVARLSESRQREALSRLATLEPEPTVESDSRPMQIIEPVSFGDRQLVLAPDGSLASMVAADGREWVDPERRVAAFRYEIFGVSDYERFVREYLQNRNETYAWADADFTKPGLELIEPLQTHRIFVPTVVDADVSRRNDRTSVVVRLTMPEAAIEMGGAPRRLEVTYSCAPGSSVVDITLQWFEKSASRLPEASWLSFGPRVANPALWEMEKLGTWISPLNVVRNGNRGLHAVGRGVRYRGADAEVLLETIDSPLLAPGEGRLLAFDNKLPDLALGWDANLHNNIWGTNFPMWFGENAKFRFRLTTRPVGVRARSAA